MRFHFQSVAALLVCAAAVLYADGPVARSARDALQPFNELVGTWTGTATPAGTREEQQKNFWTETLAFEWQFKGPDAWIKVAFDKSKHFTRGELRYVAEKDAFQLALETPSKEKRLFTGALKNKVLTLEREAGDDTERLVFTLLHPNRFLYRYEVRPAGKTLFSKKFTVGVTKDGVAFASGDGRPECIVSGGLGTTAVTYQGKTYYVCCSGCRDEFRENPEKYIKEYEEKKQKKK